MVFLRSLRPLVAARTRRLGSEGEEARGDGPSVASLLVLLVLLYSLLYYLFLHVFGGLCDDLQHSLERAKLPYTKRLSELSA